MTDYTRGTGTSGTMKIVDTGTSIEFWITSNNDSTFTDHLPWSGTVNGVGVGGSYNYPRGVGWRRLGVWGVTSSQNVTFNLGNSGTSGFGGPTTLGPIFINRATVPPAPNAVELTSIGSTTLHATFEGNGDGGSTIYIWQIGYGTNNSTPSTFIDNYDTDVTGLTPGTTYYFWARGQNAQGFGPWSIRSQATTLKVPDAPTSPVISDINPTSVVATWTPNGNGGSAITGYEIGYGTSSSAPTTTISATSPKTITGLTPGVVYYFWARAINVVGNSAWSASSTATTIAGARITVISGGVPVVKFAIPYVKVSGAWKLARPYSKNAGVWKETI